MVSKILREEVVSKDVYLPNGDGTFSKETREEDKSLRLVITNDTVGISLGSDFLASTATGDCAYLVKIFAMIDALELPEARIAHLGGGMGWLPKMLTGYGYEQDVYEKDLDIVAFLETGILAEHMNFIGGDYKDTLTGAYDIIVYDIDEYLEDDSFIKSHLKEGGKLYKLTD